MTVAIDLSLGGFVYNTQTDNVFLIKGFAGDYLVQSSEIVATVTLYSTTDPKGAEFCTKCDYGNVYHKSNCKLFKVTLLLKMELLIVFLAAME